MSDTTIDPLGDSEHCETPVSSRASVASFWIGCTGLAVLSHAAIYVALNAANAIPWLLKKLLPNLNVNTWEPEHTTRIVFGQSLMPCLVIAAVVPILFWRGGLGQRFVLSLGLGTTTMNLSVLTWGFR